MVPFSILTESVTNFQYMVQKPLNWLLVVEAQMEGELSTAGQHKQRQPKAAAAATKESTSRFPHSLVNAAATTVAAHSSTKQYYCFGNTNGQRALIHADIASLSPLRAVHQSCASGPSPAKSCTRRTNVVTDASTHVKYKCIRISESSSSVITQGFTMQTLLSYLFGGAWRWLLAKDASDEATERKQP